MLSMAKVMDKLIDKLSFCSMLTADYTIRNCKVSIVDQQKFQIKLLSRSTGMSFTDYVSLSKMKENIFVTYAFLCSIHSRPFLKHVHTAIHLNLFG